VQRLARPTVDSVNHRKPHFGPPVRLDTVRRPRIGYDRKPKRVGTGPAAQRNIIDEENVARGIAGIEHLAGADEHVERAH
jgi:hypothetical protein